VHGRAATDLLHGRCGVLAVERDPLGDIGRREDLVDRHIQAAVDKVHHQLVVGDPEVAEAPQSGARVHE
jgi:hypothetical protein